MLRNDRTSMLLSAFPPPPPGTGWGGRM